MEIVAVKKINRNFNIESFLNKKGYRPNTNYTYFDRIIFNYKQADVWHLSVPKSDSNKLDIFLLVVTYDELIVIELKQTKIIYNEDIISTLENRQ